MTDIIYPPPPIEESGAPSPSVTVIQQTNVFQIGDYTLEISIVGDGTTSVAITLTLKDSEDNLLSDLDFAAFSWLADDLGSLPEGEAIFRRSLIAPDAPGGTEWDILFSGGTATLTLERAASSYPFYLILRVSGMIVISESFSVGS